MRSTHYTPKFQRWSTVRITQAYVARSRAMGAGYLPRALRTVVVRKMPTHCSCATMCLGSSHPRHTSTTLRTRDTVKNIVSQRLTAEKSGWRSSTVPMVHNDGKEDVQCQACHEALLHHGQPPVVGLDQFHLLRRSPHNLALLSTQQYQTIQTSTSKGEHTREKKSSHAGSTFNGDLFNDTSRNHKVS